MPKKETKTEKKQVKESFNLNEAIEAIPNPYIRDGFTKYIAEIEISTRKDFDQKYKVYMGDE